MSDISEKVSDRLYHYKEMKMKDLEKAIEHMNDKGYETAPLEELSTVYRPDGTLYCNFSVDSDFLLIKMNVVGCYNPITVRLDKKVIPVLKNFLESL